MAQSDIIPIFPWKKYTSQKS